MQTITGKNLIGYNESAEGKHLFSAINPATKKNLGVSFYESSKIEIESALEKAEAAFQPYRDLSFEQRAKFLEAIADEILALGDVLIHRCMEETALPEARLTGERMRTVNQLKLFASVVREGSWIDARIDAAVPDRQPVPKPDIRQMQVPLGPVGIFGASNFPLAFSVAGGDTTSALAAGCPVIVKAHPLHPGTSELVGRAVIMAAQKLELPEGVFSMIQGLSNEVGMTLVRHPKIKAIGFTGSFKGGKALFDAANQRDIPIPVFAEMGSVNPVFILQGALKERKDALARGLIGSFTLGVGQFCTNPGLVITYNTQETMQFYNILKENILDIPPGTMLSERICNNYLLGLKSMQDIKGVTLHSESNPGKKDQVQAKTFITDADTFLKNKILAEEVFGPATLIISVKNMQEMMTIAQHMEGHLTATIQGNENDLETHQGLVKILERKVGRLIYNGFPTGVEVCHAMVHGGPFPSTTASQSTSVGTASIRRFSRPICYQDFPQSALPEPLRDHNPHNIWRLVNGKFMRDDIG